MFDSIDDAKKTITVLRDTLERKGEPADIEIFSMIAALQQLFEIADAVEQQGDTLTPGEITDIGEQGLTLIDNLLHQLAVQKYNSDMQDVQQVALVIAQWTITHHGVLMNINRGIVATRSHDLAVINTVFSELIQALPMDAPVFFKEGMSEMVRLNYPQPVRELVQEFYDRTKLPAVH